MTTKAAPKVVNHRHLSFGQRVIRDWKLNKWKYLLIIPVLVYLALFCYKPMYGLVIAFKNYKPTRGIERSAWMDPWYTWFTTFFNDPYFGRLIGNTFTISILTIIFGFPAPMCSATTTLVPMEQPLIRAMTRLITERVLPIAPSEASPFGE